MSAVSIMLNEVATEFNAMARPWKSDTTRAAFFSVKRPAAVCKVQVRFLSSPDRLFICAAFDSGTPSRNRHECERLKRLCSKEVQVGLLARQPTRDNDYLGITLPAAASHSRSAFTRTAAELIAWVCSLVDRTPAAAPDGGNRSERVAATLFL